MAQRWKAREKLRIVNQDAIGKNTRIYAVAEDGEEVDVSHCFNVLEMTFDLNGVVIAKLEAIAPKVESRAAHFEFTNLEEVTDDQSR
jgi:hypothetical protein